MEENLDKNKVRRYRVRQQHEEITKNGTIFVATIKEEDNVPRGSSLKGRLYICKDRMGIKLKVSNDYFWENPSLLNQYF